MNCPRCTHTVLQMAAREGVEIDFCPKCRGVWLDHEELEKILARSPSHEPRFVYRRQQDRRTDPLGDDPDADDARGAPHAHRRKGHFRQFFEWD